MSRRREIVDKIPTAHGRVLKPANASKFVRMNNKNKSSFFLFISDMKNNGSAFISIRYKQKNGGKKRTKNSMIDQNKL
jgi:hypothetical protein